ncbi:MAG: AtpZ/AtpI family protein [Anaerolineales bacterium]|jgi:F0F1-type ATP synthase assembly protein I
MSDVGPEENSARRRPDGYAIWGRIAQAVVRVALATFAVLAVAVGGGWWLDLRLGTRPSFMILFVLVSFPITLFLITRIVYRTARRSDPARSGGPDGVGEDDRRNLKQT